MRDRAGVARWAHNPKVVGSNPSPATNRNPQRKLRVFLFCPKAQARLQPQGQNKKTKTRASEAVFVGEPTPSGSANVAKRNELIHCYVNTGRSYGACFDGYYLLQTVDSSGVCYRYIIAS